MSYEGFQFPIPKPEALPTEEAIAEAVAVVEAAFADKVEAYEVAQADMEYPYGTENVDKNRTEVYINLYQEIIAEARADGNEAVAVVAESLRNKLIISNGRSVLRKILF
jgi:hypothetical protein